MLSVFPALFTYSFFAPLLLRLVVGLVFIDLGIIAFKGERERWLISLSTLLVPKPALVLKIIATVEIVGGILLILGLFTQLAALILGVLTFCQAFIEYKDPAILKRNLVFYTLILTITLSLLLLGPGAFSIDLPL